MPKQQKVSRRGNDVKRRERNFAALATVPGRLERADAKRRARLERNHPEKTHGRV